MINVEVNQTDWTGKMQSGHGELIYIWGIIMGTIVRKKMKMSWTRFKCSTYLIWLSQTTEML